MDKKRNSKVIKYLGKGLLFVLKTPYYAARGIYNLSKKTKQDIPNNWENPIRGVIEGFIISYQPVLTFIEVKMLPINATA